MQMFNEMEQQRLADRRETEERMELQYREAERQRREAEERSERQRRQRELQRQEDRREFLWLMRESRSNAAAATTASNNLSTGLFASVDTSSALTAKAPGQPLHR